MLSTATFCLPHFCLGCVYIYMKSPPSMFWTHTYTQMYVYLYSSSKGKQMLLLSYLVLQVCVQFFKLTANIFSEAKSTCCLVSVYGLPALLVHKIIQWIYSVMLALSFLSTRVSKSNKCHCGPVPREACIFHIPWAGTDRCSSFRVYGYYSLETSVCWVYFFWCCTTS